MAAPGVHQIISNALTVDVEDYFHVTAFEKTVRREQWDTYPSRVERNLERILNLFSEHGSHATFFVLGWVAERFPGLVVKILERGHEVACHGYAHERVYAVGPMCFREDLRKAKRLLEDIGGREVLGYRAPSFSITEQSAWALDILVEEGFQYDSSIFPIRHDVYGMRCAQTFPHEIRRAAGTIREFPLSTIAVGSRKRDLRIPVSGGGYLRLLPLWFVKMALRSINTHNRQPFVLYFHPWEIDPDQPRIKAGPRSRFRHYHSLSKTYGKVGELLQTFSFSPMGKVLGVVS